MGRKRRRQEVLSFNPQPQVHPSTVVRHFKAYRRANGILEECCDNPECLLYNSPLMWNGTQLHPILDHISGYNKDHRPENLRFLCPNCDAQLATRGGKNIGLIKDADDTGYTKTYRDSDDQDILRQPPTGNLVVPKEVLARLLQGRTFREKITANSIEDGHPTAAARRHQGFVLGGAPCRRIHRRARTLRPGMRRNVQVRADPWARRSRGRAASPAPHRHASLGSRSNRPAAPRRTWRGTGRTAPSRRPRRRRSGRTPRPVQAAHCWCAALGSGPSAFCPGRPR